MTSKRLLLLVLAGLVAGAALIGGGMVVLDAGDRDRPSAGGSAGALTPEGRELAGLLHKGLDATYHARYRSVVADPRAQGTQMTMDVWRKGALTRQEAAVQAPTTRTRSATFRLPPQTVQCAQVGDGPWTCRPPTHVRAVDPPEDAIREALGRGAINAHSETIGDVPVRCFTFPPGGDLSETCLMADGAVARIASASSHLDLVAFTSAVADEVFALPAPPQ